MACAGAGISGMCDAQARRGAHPDALQEILAAVVVPRLALLAHEHFLDDHLRAHACTPTHVHAPPLRGAPPPRGTHLRRDACVVRAREPERRAPVHTVPPREAVLRGGGAAHARVRSRRESCCSVCARTSIEHVSAWPRCSDPASSTAQPSLLAAAQRQHSLHARAVSHSTHLSRWAAESR